MNNPSIQNELICAQYGEPGPASQSPPSDQPLNRGAKKKFSREEHNETFGGYEDLKTGKIDDKKIRLLELLPAVEREEPIQCKLITTSIQEASTEGYLALSYLWGHGKMQEITLCGEPFWVRPNLLAALRRLRQKAQSCRLWVDALCINQHNKYEKPEQLQIMHLIYQNSSRVLAWIGEADVKQESDRGMDLIRDLVPQSSWIRKWRYVRDVALLFVNLATFRKMDRGVPGADAARFNENDWKAISAIRRRPYWGRVWMIQELAAPRDDPLVVCGSKEIVLSAFDTLESVVSVDSWKLNQRWVQAFDWFKEHHVEQLRMRRKFWENGSLDLCNLLLSSATFGATNRRDRVFALLNLTTEAHQKAITIDYERPLAKTYMELAGHLIGKEKDLRILSRVVEPLSPWPIFDEADNCDSEKIPKWVPKLYKTDLQGQLWAWRAGDNSYNASGDLKGNVKVRNNQVHVDGLSIDSVEEVLDCFASEDHIQNTDYLLTMANTVSKALRRCSAADLAASLHAEIPDSAPSIMCNYLVQAARARLSESTSSPFPAGPMNLELAREFVDLEGLLYYAKLARAVRRYSGIRIQRLEYSDDELWRYFEWSALRLLRNVLARRRFFSTHRGFIGVGPAGTRVGDRVCIFSRGKVCYVVRKGSNGDNSSVLMGDAYLHGFMTGEAAKWSERKKRFVLE